MVFGDLKWCLLLFLAGAFACHLNIKRCDEGCDTGFVCIESEAGAFCARERQELPTEIEMFRVRDVEPRMVGGIDVYPTLSSYVLEWNATGADSCVLEFSSDDDNTSVDVAVVDELSETNRYGRFTLTCVFGGTARNRSLITEDAFALQRLALNGVSVPLENADYLHAANETLEFNFDVGIPCTLTSPVGIEVEFNGSTSLSSVVGGLYRVRCNDALSDVERSVRVKTIALDDIVIEGESPRLFSADGFDFETQVVFDQGTPENDRVLEDLRCTLGATLRGVPAQLNGRRFVVGENEGGLAVLTQTCIDDAGREQTTSASVGLVRVVEVDDAPPTANVGDSVEISLVQIGAEACQLNGDFGDDGVYRYPATQNEDLFIECEIGNDTLTIQIQVKVFSPNAIPSLEDPTPDVNDGLFEVRFTPISQQSNCTLEDESELEALVLLSGRNTIRVRCSSENFEASVREFTSTKATSALVSTGAPTATSPTWDNKRVHCMSSPVRFIWAMDSTHPIGT